MAFFQNVFTSDFEGNWLSGDRQYIPKFVCPKNAGRGDEQIVAWKDSPYNLSGNDSDGNAKNTLVMYYSPRNTKIWTQISVNIAAGAASATAVTPEEIVGNLNNDVGFKEKLIASLSSDSKRRIVISQKRSVTEFRFYVANGRAEEVIGFNARAGIAELPDYFDRHTIANRFNFDDSQGMLIKLNPSGSNVDAALIDNAANSKGVLLGYNSASVKTDWQLLRGRFGLYTFKKITVDGSDRITQIIEYHAGSVAGDLAKKTQYTYTSANKNPDKITEIPYILTNSDLVTP